jgi:hypothetical protein
MFWEVIINANSNINLAMVYSFTGQFEMAKDVLNKRWLILYIAVYIQAIWDSYRQTIELNRHFLLAEAENAPIIPFRMTGFAINYLDKRNPSLALAWSMLFPGLGQLYLHRLPTGFILIAWCIVSSYLSHILEGLHFTLMGSFDQAIAVLDPEWALTLPSIYCFAAYEAYVVAVEYNKLYKKEQKQFLEKNYQNPKYQLLQPKGK